MKIAIEGCCHGELHKIYAALAAQEEKIDLLIICGDFQAREFLFYRLTFLLSSLYRPLEMNMIWNAWLVLPNIVKWVILWIISVAWLRHPF